MITHEQALIDQILTHPYSLYREKDRPALECLGIYELELLLKRAEGEQFIANERAKMQEQQPQDHATTEGRTLRPPTLHTATVPQDDPAL